MTYHTKIYRHDDFGFNCKPYYLLNNHHEMVRKNRGYAHTFDFISFEINSMHEYNMKIDSKNIIKYYSKFLVGCFCFLGEYDKYRLRDFLPSKRNDKINTAYILNTELIWVRNTSYKGINYPFYRDFLLNDENNKAYNDYDRAASIYIHLMWVQMPVYFALERTRLWKEQNPN